MSGKVIRTHLTSLPKQGSARRFRVPQLSHLQGVALSLALLLTAGGFSPPQAAGFQPVRLGASRL
jgi:hypothetical protein